MLGVSPKVVNAIASKCIRAYDDEETDLLNEEIRFFWNHLEGSLSTYQRHGGNQG